MSTEETINLIHEVIKPQRKNDRIRLWIQIIGFSGTILLLGIDLGDWHYWRNDMTDWKKTSSPKIETLEQYMMTQQAIENEKKMKYINSIQTK